MNNANSHSLQLPYTLRHLAVFQKMLGRSFEQAVPQQICRRAAGRLHTYYMAYWSTGYDKNDSAQTGTRSPVQNFCDQFNDTKSYK